MTSIETLEKLREKLEAHNVAGWDSEDVKREFLDVVDEYIAAERDRLPDTGETKPEPGDVVAWPNPPHGHVMIGLYGRDWTSDIGLVVLMRAAEVKRRIEEGK